ncbi:MAG: hypothetical protein REI11_13500 [Patulibacter sp.]|nr:hypothetical protein [Patulibacter sp.]
MHHAKRIHRIALAALIAPVMAGSLVSGASAAGNCSSAPGASAIQQYCEAVPEANGGSQHSRSGSSKSSGSSGSSTSGVSSSTAAKLGSAGADGAAVEQLAGGTTSTGASSSSKSDKKKDKDGAAGTTGSGSGGSGTGGGAAGAVKGIKIDGPSDPSGSPLKAATHAVANGPTVGTGVVWGLVGLSAIGAAGAIFIRRRGTTAGFEPPADVS